MTRGPIRKWWRRLFHSRQPRELRELQRLELRPGEVLVVRTRRTFSKEAHRNMIASLKHLLGEEQKILILEEGLSLSVLDPTPKPRFVVRSFVGAV